MNACLRPSRERHASEMDPTNGSTTASKTVAMNIARAHNVPETPST